MSEQSGQLTCVSCGTEFDPAPTGGFCPECDTPHPDHDIDAVAADAEAAEADADPADDEEPAVDADAADTGADAAAADDDEAEEPGADADAAAEPDVDTEDAEAAEADAEIADADVEEEAAEGGEEDAGDEAAAEAECHSCGATVDADASFCPECGADLSVEPDDEPDEEPAEDDPLAACPNCGTDVSGESFCPECGTDLDAVRERLEGEDATSVPTAVTLVVNGEEYEFGDGDTFGRQDRDWLGDLVEAAGGRDQVTYISSEHLEFEVTEEGVFAIDVSTNGSRHNGEEMDGGRVELADDDTLELAGRAEVGVEL